MKAVDNVTQCSAMDTATVTVNDPKVLLNPITGDTTICYSNSTSLSVTTSNYTGTLTYQWFKDDVKMVGRVHDTLNNIATAGAYKVVATATVGEGASACPVTASEEVTVEVLHPEVNTPTVSGTTTICNGNITTLTASVGEGTVGAITYEWSPITGLNVHTGTEVVASPASTTTYSVVATAKVTATDNSGVVCSVESQPGSVTVTVNDPQVVLNEIATNATNNTICNGGSATLTASYDETGTNADDLTGGGKNVTYEWASSTAGEFTTVPTTAEITVTPSENTTYTVTATAHLGNCTSIAVKTISITVDNPTVKLTSIGDQTICAGATATFTAQTTGVNGTQSYKWMNAVGDSLTNTQGYQTSDALVGCDTTFTVVAYATMGACVKTDTTTATLHVLDPQVKLKDIDPVTICKGGNGTTLTAVLDGEPTGTVSYEWSNGTSGTDATSITENPTTTTDYTVVATATVTANGISCPKTDSKTVTVTVNDPQVSLNTMASKTVCYGGNTSLTVSTNNFNADDLSYEWKKGNNVLAGEESSTLTLNNMQESATYTVTVTATKGECPKTATATATVTVLHPTVETPTFEGATTICQGDNGTDLTVSAVHDANSTVTYHWEPASGLDHTDVATVHANPTENIEYTVVATATTTANGLPCTATAQGKVTVTVNNPRLMLNSVSLYNNSNNAEITNAAICKGMTVKLTANATPYAENTNTYTWKKGDVVLQTGASADYVVTPQETTTYTVEVYAVKTMNNLPCTTAVQTKQVTITVNDPQVTLENIQDQTICYGTSVSLTANATSENTLSYAWTKDNDPTVIYSGQTLNVTSLTTTTTYHVLVTATVGSCTATANDDVTVTVRDEFNAGTINANNAHQEVCYGTADDQINAIANTAAEGGKLPVEYQWYHTYNNVTEPIADSTAASLTPKGYSTQAGTHTFTRKAKDQGCNDWTESVGSYVLTVYEEFKAGAIATNGQTICYGQTVNAIGNVAEATGGHGTITYKWYHKLNSEPEEEIEGAGDATFTPSAYNQVVGTHTFTRKAKSAECAPQALASSGSYVLNVNDTLALILPTTVEVCANASLDTNTVTVKEMSNGTTNAYTYGWSTNDPGASIYPNGKEVTASWPNAGTGHLTLTVINNNTQCVSHRTVEVVVNAVPVPQISGDAVVCQNSANFLTAVTLTATPANLDNYEWTYGGGTSGDGTAANVKNVSWTAVGEHTVSVKVTDGNGCSARANKIVTVNTLPIFLTVTTTPVSCDGVNNGEIVVAAGNGAEPYLYTINADSTNATGRFVGLSASSNTITVTDNNNCQAMTDANIGQAASFEVKIDSVYKTSCVGNDGKVEAKVLSDGGIYEFRLYKGNTQYGNMQLHYAWTDVNNDVFVAEHLEQGEYTLKVNASGDNDCIDDHTTFTVTVNDTLRITNIQTPPTLCSGADNSFDVQPEVNISGTTTYSWDTPVMPDGFTGADAGTNQGSVHDAGLINNTGGNVTLIYHVEATNGQCHATGEMALNVGVTVQPPVTITHPNYQVCPEQRELTLQSEFSGVVNDNTTVTWTFPNMAARTHTNVVTPTHLTDTLMLTLPDVDSTHYHYTVAFTDGVCTNSVGGNVIVPAKLEMVVDTVTMISCRYKSDGTAKVHATGGTTPYFFTMDNGAQYSYADNTFKNLSLPVNRRDSVDAAGNHLHYGKYAVTVVDGNQCTITDSVVVWAPDTMVWVGCPEPIVICNVPGESIDIVPGETFEEPYLSQILTKNGNIVKPSISYITTPGSKSITYRVKDQCVPGRQQTECAFKITVLANPSVTFAKTGDLGNRTVCEGNAIAPITVDSAYATLEAKGLPAGVTMSNGVISGTPTDDITETTSYTYTIVATSNQSAGDITGCGKDSIQGTITVNPGVTVTVSSLTQESCAGSDGAFTVNASGGTPVAPGVSTYLYQFALDDGEYTPANTDNVKDYGDKSSGTYTVRVKDFMSNCETSLPVTVTLNSPYLAPTNFVFEPVTATNICSGTTFEVTPVAPEHGNFATTYTWSAPTGNVSGGAASDASATTPITSLYDGPLTNSGAAVDTAYYTLIPTTGAICVGAPFTVKVPVNPTVVMNTPESRKLCHGDQFEEMAFSTSITDGTMSYSWTNDKPSIGLDAAGDTKINAFTAKNTTESTVVANLSVTPTYTNGGVPCEATQSTTFTITVNPQVVMKTPANQVLCHGDECDPVNFSTTIGDGQMSYSWTRKNANVTGLDAQDATNIPATVLNNTTNKPQIDTFIVTPTYTNNGIRCTGNPVEFTMTVNPKVVMTQPMDTVVCHGSQTSLSFTSNLQGGTMGYTWECDNPTIGLAATGDGETLTFTAANTGTMARVANIEVTPSYTANGKTCTGEPVTFKITVNPQVVMNTPTSPVVCNGSGASVNFSTTITGGTMTYNWLRDNENITGLGMSSSGNISATALGNATTEPQITHFSVTGDVGCHERHPGECSLW